MFYSIIFFNFGVSANKINPKTIETSAIIKNISIGPTLDTNEATYPANKFATKLLKNQTPINNEANRGGDN